MSAAPAAPPTPELTDQQKHRVQYPYGDPNGPMRALPAIQKTCTPSEAEQKRNDFRFPSMIQGEPVFYRRHVNGGNSEDIAWFNKAYNRTATLTIARPGYTIEEKSSVSYWDHTEGDPVLTGDPKAPHNNNGTFRRSQFGKLISALLEKMGGAESLGVGHNNEVAKLREEVTQFMTLLTEELDKMKAQLASVSDGTATRKRQ